jgi:Thioredoxin reductase
MAEERDLFDVTIIGGGPAGLYAAFYSGLREMKTKIIEFQPFLGGKINVYPEKVIWDVGGLPPTTGEKLIEYLVRQGTAFDPEIVLNEKVTGIDKGEDGIFVLKTASGNLHYSRTVILAIGSGILKPMKLNLEGADRFEASNLHYTVKSIGRFRDRTVLIAGGGNSAIDWANELGEIARKVYLTYRKDTLKGHEASVTKLAENGVVCLPNTEIVRLFPAPDGDRIERVALRDLEEDTTAELRIDDLVVCHGYDLDRDIIDNSNVRIEMKDEYYVAGTPMGETSVPGLFAAGDILTHEGKLHLIAGCFQDAANAVNKAKQYITPDAPGYGMVSSHNELFKERNRELKKQLFAGLAARK